jgi:FkbM family methyltransferase
MLAPTQPLGRAVRLPLRLIPKTAILPILSGANRGLKWTVGAGTHGCWLGRYERQEIAWLLSQIDPDAVVWDIGAHAGYVAMACARRCRRVVACEASPENVAFLRNHVTLNQLHNVSIVEAAISSRDDEFVSFGSAHDGYQGRIGGQGATVRTSTIDGLVAAGLPAPSFVKMDIEGGEADALQGGIATLTQHHPSMLIAVHSETLAKDCQKFLEQIGYEVAQVNDATLWATAEGLDKR